MMPPLTKPTVMTVVADELCMIAVAIVPNRSAFHLLLVERSSARSSTPPDMLSSEVAAIAGNRVGDVSSAVQEKAESGGYSVVRELVGHGLGRKLHEPPEVANFGKRGTGPKMEKGLVICIEPMINLGRKDTLQLKDGWTIVTADGKPSAHFEYAVAVNKGKADVLTTFEFIDEVLNNS